MKAIALGLFAGVVVLATPAVAQDADFNLTYHVERTPAARLSIEACGQAVTQAARQAGLRVATQRYPAQLVLVSGGRRGIGAFVTQCIAVGGTTVSVVNGTDYRAQKGAIGSFADRAFAAIRSATK